MPQTCFSLRCAFLLASALQARHQLLSCRVQRLFFFGKVKADVAVLGLAEKATAGHARNADFTGHPLCCFGVGFEAER